MSLFGTMLSCGRLVDLRHCAAFGRFLDNFESHINVCNMNNVDNDHGDLIIVHLCCLFDFSLLMNPLILLICSHFVDRITVRTSFDIFILGYFINMPYGHIASDKCAIYFMKGCLLSLLILHRKRTFHSAI